MKAELEIEATTDDLEEVVRFVDAQLEQADGSMKTQIKPTLPWRRFSMSTSTAGINGQ